MGENLANCFVLPTASGTSFSVAVVIQYEFIRSQGIDELDLRLPLMTLFAFDLKPSRKERDEMKRLSLVLFDEGAKTEAFYAEARAKSGAASDDIVLEVSHRGAKRFWHPEEAR